MLVSFRNQVIGEVEIFFHEKSDVYGSDGEEELARVGRHGSDEV